MSIWRLLVDPPQDGPWNMAVDELLLELAAERSQGALRFYRWREPTLSLGYFQRYEERRQHAASADCPVVRRLSGGGAILHDHEITYSMAMPANDPLAADRDGLYRLAHSSLIAALRHFGFPATLCEEPRRTISAGVAKHFSQQSDHDAQQADEPFLCFDRRASVDVVCSGHKIAGSAQRRRRGAVLQHGSLILRRSPAAPTIAGLSDVTGILVEAEALIDRWAEKVANFGIALEPAVLSETEVARAAELVETRYANPLWTELRQGVVHPTRSSGAAPRDVL